MKWKESISSSPGSSPDCSLSISHKPWLHSPQSEERQFRLYFRLSGLTPLSDFCLVHLNWIKLSQTFWTEGFCLTEPFYRFYRVGTQFPLGRVERRCEGKKCWAGLVWKPTKGYQGTLQSTLSLSSPRYVPPKWIPQTPTHFQCLSALLSILIQASRLVVEGRLVLYKTFTLGHWLHIKYSKLLSLH